MIEAEKQATALALVLSKLEAAGVSLAALLGAMVALQLPSQPPKPLSRRRKPLRGRKGAS